MTTQEGLEALGMGTAARHDRAYFLDLLGDSHNGLGCYEAAIEAYRQAAQEFEGQGARCSYALCLLKIADSYLALQEPWHAVGYLEACLPLLRELGLVRHVSLAQHRLAACQAELAPAPLLGEGRDGQRSGRARPSRSAGSAPPPQAARSAPPPQAARSAASPPGRG
jgi:tetratricopeptide (TPR) repeat protein